MTTINCELSKKLNDLGLLDNIDTEYYYADSGMIFIKKDIGNRKDFYKTLTLEEAIEFLPNFTLDKVDNQYIIYYKGGNINGVSTLEVIDKLLNYLIDNKLIG